MAEIAEKLIDGLGDLILTIISPVFNCIYDSLVNIFLKLPYLVSKSTGESFIDILFKAFGGFEPHEYIGILVTFTFAVIAVRIVFNIISNIVG